MNSIDAYHTITAHMNNFASRNGRSTVADLHGRSFQPETRLHFPPANSYMRSNINSIDFDDFGFDPPPRRRSIPKSESEYTPSSAASVDGLADSPSVHNGSRRALFRRKCYEPSIVTHLPYAAPTISRHGQITPPRSSFPTSSTSSRVPAEQNSPLAQKPRGRKVEVKTEKSSKPEVAANSKRRKASRKRTNQATMPAAVPEHDKRKKTLEKNRLAAAKCRINKNVMISQLQRDSHDKAAENTYLKEIVRRMTEEIQELQIVLMCHSSSDHCKNSGSIYEVLGVAGSDDLASQVASNHFLLMQPQEATMQHLGHDESIYSNYFQPCEAPALPDFNLSADLEICTPILGD
jgi:hypothetical protein